MRLCPDFKIMFKFNFLGENSENAELTNPPQSWIESEEIEPKHIPLPEKFSEITCGDSIIKNIASGKTVEDLKSANDLVKKLDSEHSDLLTAIYEGGLKVWECTYDLLNYLINSKLEIDGKRVLDLGCGAGIVGISAALRGASNIYFQDYNKEVLEALTIPNCLLNNIPITKCKFYSGDWASFTRLIDTKFDYIFTSETIYNVDNYPKLIELFTKLLHPEGKIILAAKEIYFGVGGSADSFVNFTNSHGFTCKTCWNCEVGVKRTIIEIEPNKN